MSCENKVTCGTKELTWKELALLLAAVSGDSTPAARVIFSGGITPPASNAWLWDDSSDVLWDDNSTVDKD